MTRNCTVHQARCPVRCNHYTEWLFEKVTFHDERNAKPRLTVMGGDSRSAISTMVTL